MKTLLLIAAILPLAACNKAFPIVHGTHSTTYTHETWMVMGQSNADRFAKMGGPDAFTIAIQSFHPGTIDWINCSVGGTSISQWTPSGPLFQACVDAAKGHKIAGIIWDQGESEAEQGDVTLCDDWTMNFTTMINSFRSVIGNRRAIVLYARLGPAKGLPNTDNERQAQEAVHIQFGHMVDLDAFPVPLGLHYDPSTYGPMAKAYADAYKLLTEGE